MSVPARWTRRNRRIYNSPIYCRLCGTAWGTRSEERRYAPTTCMACGSTVCMGHGLGNGKCPICLFGLLPGWYGSNKICNYKGCDEPAIAQHPGRRTWHVCKKHWERARGKDLIDLAMHRRGREWVLVSDDGQEVDS